MTYIGYYDGNFLPQNEMPLAPENLAFTRGFAAFELLRTYDREPFYLEDHLERFFFSIASLYLPKPQVDLKKVIDHLLLLNRDGELVFRLYYTELEKRTLLVVLTDKVVSPSDEEYEKGIAVITTPLQRTLVRSKTTCYLAGQLALKQAALQKATEAIFLSTKNELLELTRANFFCVIGQKLYTPKEGILLGITRKIVLAHAERLGIGVVEGPILETAIPTFSEAFLTSSIKEIVPIRKIDQAIIPIGPLSHILRRIFQSRECPNLSSI